MPANTTDSSGPSDAKKPGRKKGRRARLLVLVLVLALVAGVGYGAYWSSVHGAGLVPADHRADNARRPFRRRRGQTRLLRIPQIYADSDADLFRAQGFVQAQDRFWEMDVRRHMTSGRLSEMFGSGQVETDAFLRTLGWRQVAQKEYDEVLDESTKKNLQSYAEGVNAYLKGKEGRDISVEYAALGLTNDYKPGEWTPVDSVAWLKAMAWDLRGNMQDEIDRSLLTSRLDQDQIEDLYPGYPYKQHKPIVEQGAISPVTGKFDPRRPGGQYRLHDSRRASRRGPDHPVRRALRHPRRDPGAARPERQRHRLELLGRRRRAHHVRQGVARERPAPRADAALPLVPDGSALPEALGDLPVRHGRLHLLRHARCDHRPQPGHRLGLTNLGADVTDLFLEKVSDDGYLYGGETKPFKTREETIKVAGGKDRTITVRETNNGPLVSDRSKELDKVGQKAVSNAAPDRADGYAVALKWTALQPGKSMDAVFAINRAKDFTTFRAAAQNFEVPSQNLIYADTEGNIGYQAREDPGSLRGLRRYGPGAGLGPEVRVEGLHPLRRAALRVQPGPRLHRHRQPGRHRRGEVPPPPDQGLGLRRAQPADQRPPRPEDQGRREGLDR